MDQRQVKLFELPENLLFSLKDVTYTPSVPRMKEAFIVKGKVQLFGLPFVALIWVIAKVTYPEEWWEEIIPIIGSPTVGEGQMALGGDFEIAFSKGFDREGEFALDVEVHLGPTYTLDSITLPPFPPLAKQEATFIVGGEVPPEELGFRNFRVVSYSKNGGTPVTPPNVLNLNVGDRCRVNLGCDHMDGAVTPKMHAAIGNIHTTPTEWFDEVLFAEKTFGIPASTNWTPWIGYVDIIITSAISPGTYSLYAKIMGITGGDIFTPDYSNVITIAGVPPTEADIKDFDFVLTHGTYKVGDKVPFTAPYDYKGPAQNGQLTISIGTGVYPTFNTIYTYPPIVVVFAAAADWATRGLQGAITLPSVLQPGQTYSVRAKLETLTAPTQETDTDWSAFDIAAGPPTSDIQNFDFVPQGGTYDLGDSVPYTAPYEYKGKAQSGTLIISLGTGVYPTFTIKYTFPSKSVTFKESMDWTPDTLSGSFTLPSTLEPGQTYSVRAQLKTADGKQETDTDWGVIKITAPPEMERLEVNIDPAGGGYVTTSPAPSGGTENNWLFPKGTVVYVTAHPNSGYQFKSWSGEMTDSTAITAPVYPMTETRGITAHFEEVVVPPQYVSFRMEINSDGAGQIMWCDRWMVYYYDPKAGKFVGDSEWHFLSTRVNFDYVAPGGYLAVFLLNSETGQMSDQISSDSWDILDAHTYEYNPYTNRIIDIS